MAGCLLGVTHYRQAPELRNIAKPAQSRSLVRTDLPLVAAAAASLMAVQFCAAFGASPRFEFHDEIGAFPDAHDNSPCNLMAQSRWQALAAGGRGRTGRTAEGPLRVQIPDHVVAGTADEGLSRRRQPSGPATRRAGQLGEGLELVTVRTGCSGGPGDRLWRADPGGTVD